MPKTKKVNVSLCHSVPTMVMIALMKHFLAHIADSRKQNLSYL